MRMRTILTAMTAGLCLAAVVGGAETPTATDLDELVNRLASPAYRERTAATRALDALGEAALDALRRAAQSKDPEARRRATDLVERIEQRLATARLLAPALVDLDVQNVSPTEAVAEFNRKTSANVRIQSNDPVGTNARRVTVRTGPVPFWEALEQLCKATDLREWDGLTPLGPTPAPTRRNRVCPDSSRCRGRSSSAARCPDPSARPPRSSCSTARTSRCRPRGPGPCGCAACLRQPPSRRIGWGRRGTVPVASVG